MLRCSLDEARAENTVLVLLNSGFAHAFHYHAQVAGAEYISRAPSVPWLPFRSEIWLRLGPARIMTISKKSDYYNDLQRFEVRDGDEIWLLGDDAFPLAADMDKLPKQLSLVEIESFDNKVRLFRVVERSNPGFGDPMTGSRRGGAGVVDVVVPAYNERGSFVLPSPMSNSMSSMLLTFRTDSGGQRFEETAPAGPRQVAAANPQLHIITATADAGRP